MSRSSALFEPQHAIFAPSVAGAPPSTTSNTSSSGSTTPHKLILPACYHGNDRSLIPISDNPIKQKEDLKDYIQYDLDVTRLNAIHKHLWLAGLPILPRPLHAQIMMGRQITITEKTDLHLLWRDRELYLKPLPEYLLSHSTWTSILTHPSNSDLHASASGLLYSYISLITTKSDLSIAHSSALLSRSITWEQWTTFTSAVHTSLNISARTKNNTPSLVNKRYIYGELRLARVNFIYRFLPKSIPPSPSHNPHNRTSTSTSLIKAYHHRYTDYTTFFARNFAWLITVVVYVTVVLTAMQVGLATHQLGDDEGFNRASYGFTVFAIVGPLAVVGFMLFFGLGLVGWNLRYAIGKRGGGLPLEMGDGGVRGGNGSGSGSGAVNAGGVNGNMLQMQKLNGNIGAGTNGN